MPVEGGPIEGDVPPKFRLYRLAGGQRELVAAYESMAEMVAAFPVPPRLDVGYELYERRKLMNALPWTLNRGAERNGTPSR